MAGHRPVCGQFAGRGPGRWTGGSAAFTNYCPPGPLAVRRVQGLTDHCGTGESARPGWDRPRPSGNGGRAMTSNRGSRTKRLPGMAAAAFLAVLLPAGLATAASASAGSASAGSAPARVAARASAPASCPWLNQSLPVSQRLKLLMAKMTLADKINMVTGAGTSQPYVFYISAIPSLCIPAMGEEDGPVGVGDGLTGVTQLPSAVSLAATWDRALASPVREGRRVGGARQGRHGQPGPDREHRPRPALGAVVRGLHRGPVPQRGANRVGHRRGAEPGRDVPGQALRRVQPGDQPEHAGR